MLSFDEYLELDNKNENYIRGFLNVQDNVKVVSSGFIDWNDDEVHNWAGAWSDRYVLVTVVDHSLEYGLLTKDERTIQYHTYHTFSIYNFPYRLHYQVDCVVYVSDAKCQRQKLTHAERTSFMQQMTQDELFKYEAKILENDNTSFLELEGFASVEKPFRVHLAGNDDYSQSATFATKDEALRALLDIGANPTFATLKEHNFVFTN